MEKNELSYPTALVISLAVSLPLAMIPFYLGLMFPLNPLFFVVTFVLSSIGASLGYATKRLRWIWLGAISGAILPVGSVLAFILITLGTH